MHYAGYKSSVALVLIMSMHVMAHTTGNLQRDEISYRPAKSTVMPCAFHKYMAELQPDGGKFSLDPFETIILRDSLNECQLSLYSVAEYSPQINPELGWVGLNWVQLWPSGIMGNSSVDMLFYLFDHYLFKIFIS